MDKLFEHIDGNRFKLNESRMVIPRNSKYTINKVEEMENLQYIRKILVPYAVQFWNKLSIPNIWQMTDEKVGKNLKKHKHKIGSQYMTDIIYYISVVKLPGQGRNHHFKFVTYKDDDGTIKNAFDIGASGFGYRVLDNDNKTSSHSVYIP